MEIRFEPPSYFNDVLKRRDKETAVKEFEALMIKAMLKEAMKPALSNKSFGYRMYYDYFLEAVSKKMAESGGIGLGRYIMEKLKEDNDRR